MSISYLNAERYADPTAYQALTNIEREEKRQFRPLVYVCSPYSGNIDANIPNVEYQTLLEKRYLCFQSWEQISVDLSFSMQHTFRMHDAALKMIAIPIEE